jgi:hypothetical protein
MAAMRKLPVVLFCRTSSVLRKSANQKYIPGQPASTRGTFGQSLPDVRRVAMDAIGAQDEARLMRSTKPCGPDTPTLV